MNTKRSIARIDTPEGHPGFLGPGHIARAVIQGGYAHSDPFILLMDDQLDKKDSAPSGGPHPHAGFETVTLVIEGEMGLGTHAMQTGDMQMMTAGSGVIHTETIDKPTRVRILQLWIALPKAERSAAPRVQDISLARVPQLSGDGVRIRVYSGAFAGLQSPVANYVPLILADIGMAENAVTTQTLPASFNTFLYVLEGSVRVGEDRTIAAGQAGWLDRSEEAGDSELRLTAGRDGARLVLYAGQPQGDPLVSHGPFIADREEDLSRLYSDYRGGKMGHITAVPEERRIVF